MTMNQRDDLGDVTPGDYLAQVTSGQDWGFPDCYGQGGSACSGAPKAIAELDKHAAVAWRCFPVRQARRPGRCRAGAMGSVLKVQLSGSSGNYSGTAGAFVTGIESPVPVIASGSDSLLIGDGQRARSTA